MYTFVITRNRLAKALRNSNTLSSFIYLAFYGFVLIFFQNTNNVDIIFFLYVARIVSLLDFGSTYESSLNENYDINLFGFVFRLFFLFFMFYFYDYHFEHENVVLFYFASQLYSLPMIGVLQFHGKLFIDKIIKLAALLFVCLGSYRYALVGLGIFNFVYSSFSIYRAAFKFKFFKLTQLELISGLSIVYFMETLLLNVILKTPLSQSLMRLRLILDGIRLILTSHYFSNFKDYFQSTNIYWFFLKIEGIFLVVIFLIFPFLSNDLALLFFVLSSFLLTSFTHDFLLFYGRRVLEVLVMSLVLLFAFILFQKDFQLGISIFSFTCLISLRYYRAFLLYGKRISLTFLNLC